MKLLCPLDQPSVSPCYTGDRGEGQNRTAAPAIGAGSTGRADGPIEPSRIIVGVLILVLACSGVTGAARAQSAPPSAPAATSPARSTVKPAARKVRTSAKPPAPAESGPCQIGVIAALGDQFVLQKVGLTVFGNDQAEAHVDSWGFDDLAVARVRAAVPSKAVRRMTYAPDAFAPYYHPPGLFSGNRTDLATIVRQIAAGTRCERYLVVTRFNGQLAGTNQSLEGIGILNRSAGFLDRNFLFANINVTMFDGQNFEKQSNPADTFGARLSAGFSGEGAPQLIEVAFPQSAADAVNSKELRERTRALLTSRLDRILSGYLTQQP